MEKETLQAMILQLQPAKEAGERETTSRVTAGPQGTQASLGGTAQGKEGE